MIDWFVFIVYIYDLLEMIYIYEDMVLLVKIFMFNLLNSLGIYIVIVYIVIWDFRVILVWFVIFFLKVECFVNCFLCLLLIFLVCIWRSK